MYKKRGFTLVELLVVMAIISILAAIAIPNVQKWIKRGKAVSAIAEISNMELSITKLLSDAERGGLDELLNMQVLYDEVVLAHSAPASITPALPELPSIKQWDEEAFEIATEIYTNIFYTLLRKGRGAVSSVENLGGNLLRPEAVQKLGTSYMSELGFDPWGNLYQIYPGPWSSNNGLIPFRTYLPPAVGVAALPGDDATAISGDDLSLGSASNAAVAGASVDLIDLATDEDIPLTGIPASRQMDVYIWSKGANLESGQARFVHPDVAAYDPADGFLNYNDTVQEPEFLGGGDDINNWDRDTTFMQFYN